MRKLFTVSVLTLLMYSTYAQNNKTTSNLGAAASGFPLAGTWILTAAEVVLPDGTRAIDPGLGKDAKGVLMIDREGQYSLQIFKADRPKFASGDKRRGTPEEYSSALLGLSTHTGHIKMDTVNKTLQFNIDYAAFPNWEHSSQTRNYTLTGNELFYQLPAAAGAGTVAASSWTRIRSN